MKTIALVRFTPKVEFSPEGYKAAFEKAIPVCQNADGLNRKYFTATETGSMGIYVWDSKEQAEEFYKNDQAWNAAMEATATDASFEFVQVRGLLDNDAGVEKLFI